MLLYEYILTPIKINLFRRGMDEVTSVLLLKEINNP